MCHIVACCVDQSFQLLVIFFFLKRTQSDALLSAISRLTSHITSSPDDAADADASESMFEMECQNVGTHVAGYPSALLPSEPSVSESQAHPTSDHSSPVFGRRSIHDVKPTAGLQALHEYDGCDQDDEPQDPLHSVDGEIEEIVVPIGFNSPVIKYVNHVLSSLFLLGHTL